MTFNWFDFLLPAIAALAWLFLSWSYGRSITGGRQLSTVMRRITVYGFLFVLGVGYVMLIGSRLRWPHSAWFALIAVWGLLLASIAGWRHRRGSSADSAKRPLTLRLRETMPSAVLLICLVGTAIEWELVVNGQGHIVFGVLWTAGVAIMIIVRRSNRRATVLSALRPFLGLLIIGALVRQSTVTLAAAGVTAVGLFLLERLWRTDSSRVHFNLGGGSSRS
jgi:hypothetical protein